jgi:hypothetical protein
MSKKKEMNIEKSMILVSSNWGPYKTFKLIPINTECPYVEAIFDPSSKILAIISKLSKPSYHMVPKLDDNGDQVTVKLGKRPNGKEIKEQRVMMDTYQEYYVNDLEEVKTLINAFAINADTYDYTTHLESEVTPAGNPMPAEKATNLEIVT